MQRRERKKKEQNTSELWNNIKQYKIHIIRKIEGEERVNGREEIFAVLMTEKYP